MFIVLVSSCLGEICLGGELFMEFHFRGYYMGQFVKKVYAVKNEISSSFVEGEEYLIYAKVLRPVREDLVVNVVRVKNLREIYL